MKIKSLLFALAAVWMFSTNPAMAQQFKSNSEVSNEWRTKVISVKGGGQTPDVVTLLKAFHKALPTWVVGEVLKQQAHPAQGTKREGTTLLLEDNDEDELTILIDPRNGYVGYSSLTDVDQMSCCVWRKNNGHRIFAISLYEQHDPVQNLLCWYDYDPKTQTMKAAESPLDHYQKPFERMDVSWSLPRKGTDFLIHEYYYFDANFTQVYSWDGNQFSHSKTKIDDFTYQTFYENDWEKASEQGYDLYALIDIDRSGSPSLCLRRSKDQDDYILILNDFKGHMQTVSVVDEADILESIFRVKPEEGQPWTDKDVVVYTRDFEHVHYYVVLQDGNIGYIVTTEPNSEPTIRGYGAKDESIDIFRATTTEEISINPQWKPCEFIISEE